MCLVLSAFEFKALLMSMSCLCLLLPSQLSLCARCSSSLAGSSAMAVATVRPATISCMCLLHVLARPPPWMPSTTTTRLDVHFAEKLFSLITILDPTSQGQPWSSLPKPRPSCVSLWPRGLPSTLCLQVCWCLLSLLKQMPA